MQPKKSYIVVLAAIVLFIGLAVVQYTYFSDTSTHHSSITVSLPDGAPQTAQRIADFDKISAIVDAWAAESGFARVATDAAGSMRQSWSSTRSNGDEKIIYYKEDTPKDPEFPMEIMMVFDPDGSPKVEIAAAEGYHKKPTQKLQTVHADLNRLLAEAFPDRVKSGIW